jgi:hypothetical protein
VGVLTDYFIAKNDSDAARAHTSPGGPKRAGFPTAEWKSIDPVVCMAALDEAVTGAMRSSGTNRSRRIRPSLGRTMMSTGSFACLVRLARDARAAGAHLYCWVSL